MLGRLRMSIPDAIKHFKILSKTVFPGTKSWSVTKFLKSLVGTAYFDPENMEQAVKKLLDELHLDQNLPLMESPNPRCKV